MNQYTSDDFDRDDSDGRGIHIHVDNDRYGPTHDFDSRDNGQDIQTIHVDNDRHGPTHDFDRDDGQDIQIIHADNDRYSPSHDFARNDVIYDQDFTRSHVVDMSYHHVRDTLLVNMDPVRSLALPSGKEVSQTITELLECSKYSPLDLERISGFIFQDDNSDVQLAALELLKDAAESEKENFIEFMPVTFNRVTHLLSSPDFRVHWGALDVLTCFFSSGYHDQAVKSVVPSILRHLQSPEPDVQLACVGVLDVAARSNSMELVDIVAPTLPALVRLLSSDKINIQYRVLNVLRACAGLSKLAEAVADILPNLSLLLSSNEIIIQDTALCVLKVSAESSKDKLAEAVADILPYLAPLLSADPGAHPVAKALLDASARSNNRKLVAAAATLLSDLLFNTKA